MKMAFVGKIWIIEKFCVWKDRQWNKPLVGKNYLRLHYDQLIVCSENVIYETFSLKNNTTKGYLKESTLIIIYDVEAKTRKIKIKFACTKTELDALIKAMSSFCLIQDVQNLQSPQDSRTTLSSFQEMFKGEMERQNNFAADGTLFPDGFPFEEFLKICIVDPNFPKIVDQVEKSLHQYLH